MTEEKRKRGRPRKVTIEELKAAFEPTANDPVSLDLPALVREAELASGISKDEAVVSEGLHQKRIPSYDPFKNPFFKSKNGIDKDKK